MITATQVAYMSAQENKRHNLENESLEASKQLETHRSNIIKEQETERSNRANEAIGTVNAVSNIVKSVSSGVSGVAGLFR